MGIFSNNERRLRLSHKRQYDIADKSMQNKKI